MARGFWVGSVVCGLVASPGCAKLHHKLHKHHHNQPAFGTYSSSPVMAQPGFASVSPQMAEPYPGQTLYKTAPKSQPASQAYSSPNSGSGGGTVAAPTYQAPESSQTIDPPPMIETPRSATTPMPKPDVPGPATIQPAKPAVPPAASPASTIATPPPVKPPGIPAPSINLPNLPPADTLPLPPATAPRASGNSSPFASTGTPRVATNGSSNNSTLTLSQPGDDAGPMPAPAEEKLRPTLSIPSNAGSNKPPDAPSPPNAPSAANRSTSIKPNEAVAKLDRILSRTSLTLSQTKTYSVQVSLQEQLNGRILPPDSFQLNKRREPLAIHMLWSQGKEAGREVIFSPVETNGMIQIRMPKGLIPRLTMSPESPLVRSKSRHPITQAGADSVVERLNETLVMHKQNRPDAGRLDVTSVVEPVVGQVDRVTHLNSAGETWVVDMDPASGLPLTIHATDKTGLLLEHYEFRKYELNRSELLTANAFDPNSRWGQASLFSKIAKGNTTDTSTKR